MGEIFLVTSGEEFEGQELHFSKVFGDNMNVLLEMLADGVKLRMNRVEETRQALGALIDTLPGAQE